MLISLGRGLSPRQNSGEQAPIIIPDTNDMPNTDTPSLDAPINSALLNNNQDLHAFHLDRVVEGYTGNTVQLSCATATPTTQDFGFDTNGYFDIASVETWAGTTDDIIALKQYDQTGNGGECNAEGTIYFRQGGAYTRFGGDYDVNTGLLTRGDFGSFGFNHAGSGVWKISNTTIPVSTDGVEAFVLTHMNTRKVEQPTLDIDKNGVSLGGNNNNEWTFSYGTGNNNYYGHRFFSTFGTFAHFDTLNQNSINDIGGNQNTFPQYGQFIMHFKMNVTGAGIDIYGAEDTYKDAAANAITDIQNGELDNGFLLIGGSFANNVGDVGFGERANFTTGAILITKELNPKDSWIVQAKTGAIGQQHRLKSKTDIESLFDDALYMSNANTANGQVTGINNKITLDWNEGTNAQGTTTTNFNHIEPLTGLTGINIPDQNQANGFRATTNYFAGTISGTILGFGVADIPSNQLAYMFVQGQGDGFSTSSENRSLALGKDHNTPTFFTTAASPTRDPNIITGSRRDENGNSIGDKFGNQEMVKYNRNTAHSKVNINTNVDGYAGWTFDSLANNDPNAPYKFDAPISIPVQHNQAFREYNNIPLLQVATFEAPAGYDRSADQATRDALFLQAVNKSYLGLTGSNIGHVQSDVAINNNASVVDSTDDARISSSHWFDNYEGTILMMAFIPDVVLTQTQIEEITVNLWKLFEQIQKIRSGS